MKVLEHEHPLELVDLQPPKIVDVWEEESDDDDDDDDLIIEEEFRRPCNRCYQDITVYHRYYYKCTLGSCDILLHKFCAELPPMLNHTSHTHTLRQGIYDWGSWACQYCQSQHKTGEVFYSCDKCYYNNIDVNCVIDVEKKSIHHPSHPHKLVCTISTPILCHCKACGRKHEGIFYNCTTCFFTIHSDCAFLPKKMLIQKTTDDAFSHPHPLTISYSFPRADKRAKYFPRCRVCNYGFYDHLWIYKCEKCMYYAHVDCATSRREPFMSILSSPGSGRLVKNYKDADYPDLLHLPFPDESHNILKHLFFKNNGPGTFEMDDEVNLKRIKHQHQVILVDTECIDSKVGSSSSKINSFMLHNPMKKIELLCNGCLRPIMSMPFYKCAQNCGFALHEWCTRLPTSIDNHPGHPQHPLILLPSVPHKFFSIFSCEVCALDCNGFAYGCVECEYYVDVSCGFIPEKITHKAHPNHLLSRVKLNTYGLCQCHICRTYMRGDSFTFSCSICDNILIHPECALLLPGTIRHKYDKHPMSLSYLPIENHKSEYFCEICEEPLNPHQSFYHCHNHKCVQSVHSDCAPLILRSEMAARRHYWDDNSIYKFVNVKFGSIHKTHDHPHPLSFTQGIASDGECNRCGRELRYEMIFKCLECKYAIDYYCCKNLNSS